MKKRLYPLFFTACGLVAFTSCNNDENEVPPINQVSEITINAVAPEGHTWQTGDAIGLFAIPHGEALAGSDKILNNVKVTFDGSRWLAENATIETGSSLDYYAYSPYSTTATNPSDICFSLNSDRTDAIVSENILIANALEQKEKEVTLNFNPCPITMAHVNVSIPAGTRGYGPSENLKVSIQNISASFSIDLGNASCTLIDGKERIPMLRIEQEGDENYLSSYSYTVQIPAQIVKKGNSLFQFNHEDWKIIDDEALDSDMVLSASEPTELQRNVKGLLHTVYITAGDFKMGGNASEYFYAPHTVTLTQNFRIAKYEVTIAQYAEFLNDMGIGQTGYRKFPTNGYGTQDLNWENQYLKYNNGKWQAVEGYENYAMGNTTWYGAYEFSQWLGMQLPTEAQWEYACRAGTTSEYSFGDDYRMLDDYAWWSGNRPEDSWIGTPVEVGVKLPNPWGLYDMHGNASEWTADFWNEKTYRYEDGLIDPAYPGEKGQVNGYRIIRSGSVFGNSNYPNGLDCCSAAQILGYGGYGHPQNGFRPIVIVE